jgi:hypothetical protein
MVTEPPGITVKKTYVQHWDIKIMYSPTSEPNPKALPLIACKAPSPIERSISIFFDNGVQRRVPPDDPPGERRWFSGFQRYPRMLLSVSGPYDI